MILSLIALTTEILKLAINVREKQAENQQKQQQKVEPIIVEKEVEIKTKKQPTRTMETPRKYSKSKLKSFATYLQIPILDTCIELKENGIIIPFVKAIAGRRKQVEVSLYTTYEYNENSVILNSLNIHHYKCNTELTTYQVAGIETDYIHNSIEVNANTESEFVKFIKSKYPNCKLFMNDKIVSFVNGEQKIVVTHYKHKAEALAKITLQIFKE